MNSGGAGRTALIYGIAVAGDALATGLMRRGWRVLVADDAPTEAKRALAAGLGTNLVEAPDTEALAELVAAVDIVCPARGPRDASGRRCSSCRRHSLANRDRSGLRVGAAAPRWPAADAGHHRHRRQDHHHPAHRAHPGGRRPPSFRGRQHRRAAGRCARRRRRRVRGRVQQLPPELAAVLSRGSVGVAEPGPRPPELAHLDGIVRSGQGTDVGAPQAHRCGHRLRRRRDGDAQPARRAAPRARSPPPTPTTASTMAPSSGRAASSLPSRA